MFSKFFKELFNKKEINYNEVKEEKEKCCEGKKWIVKMPKNYKFENVNFIFGEKCNRKIFHEGNFCGEKDCTSSKKFLCSKCKLYCDNLDNHLRCVNCRICYRPARIDGKFIQECGAEFYDDRDHDKCKKEVILVNDNGKSFYTFNQNYSHFMVKKCKFHNCNNTCTFLYPDSDYCSEHLKTMEIEYYDGRAMFYEILIKKIVSPSELECLFYYINFNYRNYDLTKINVSLVSNKKYINQISLIDLFSSFQIDSLKESMILNFHNNILKVEKLISEIENSYEKYKISFSFEIKVYEKNQIVKVDFIDILDDFVGLKRVFEPLINHIKYSPDSEEYKKLKKNFENCAKGLDD